ncbi:hypothetical protein, partial [Salinibacterium sp.]|uniref:hypothetical protein n=1 Tax=Salinibacterium sp. TaxID=1915057 RepID=UPI00286D5D41
MTTSRRHPARRRILIITAAVVGSVAVLAAVIVGVGGAFTPSRYLEPWSADYHSNFDDPRVQLVSVGLLASSGHNMQPWLVRLDSDPNVFYLYADGSRLSPAVDPLARQVMVSQGTFLQYVTVAGQQLGHPVTVELFPDGDYDETDPQSSMASTPVARVTLSSGASTAQPTWDSLFRSDTNRAPYTDAPLTEHQRGALADLDRGSEATLSILTQQQDLDSLGRLAIEGSTIESQSAAATAESDAVFRSSEYLKNDSRWGFSVEGQGTAGAMKYLIQGLITLIPAMNSDDAGAQRQIDLTTAAVAATPAYGIISTSANTRREQVEAGMLYSQFDLTARSMGLVMQP